MNADKYLRDELDDLSGDDKEIAKEHYEVLTDLFGENYEEFLERILPTDDVI